ncbi:peptidoglycan DD-metalloendopeptidase family protein [Actinotalea sp.]|uniref:peptidoglycan DD-metalloendopeptidase family protein n=1 Tax=Actinotalea sp. TaxID=1872145 RepID=UPI0035626C3E
MRRKARATLAAFLALVVLSIGAALPSAADTYDDERAQTEAAQKAVDEALAALQGDLEDTDEALIQAYAELKGIEAQVPVAQEQLAAAETLLATVEREAALIAQRLEAAQSESERLGTQIETGNTRASELRAAIGQMARDAYKGDLATSSFTAVLDSTSTEDYIEQTALAATALRTQTQALHEVEQIVATNRNLAARQEAVAERVAVLKAEADAKVIEAEEARVAAAERKAQVESLLAEQEAKTASLESLKADQVAKAQELADQQAALEADLKEIVRKQEEARKAAGQSPIGSTASQPFINPTSINPIYKTSDYGMRFHPVLLYWRMHAGTDLRTYCGTEIYAAASGTVQWAKFRSGYGNQVMINNGYWNGSSLMSSYNHMSSFTVSSGQQVSQGTLIGYSGNTGTSAACHLHFEVYVNGATVDPWPLIAK